MISPTDFKRGSTKILWNNEPWLVIEFHHVKPGKGGAYVRTKLKNLKTGRILEQTFRSEEKLATPDIEYKKMQFLYTESGIYHFMDQQDYEQFDFGEDQIESVKTYLKENEVYNVVFFDGKPISVEPPTFMILEIKETVPGVRGDTAQGGTSKPATLETGLVVHVPLFLNEGEKIKVDTRSGEYVERA
ncbi:elongation factor P [Candidatus Babeliales bacterium]|nr:elongation factor P [Candidatus Babeliales bacterium]